MFYINGKRFLKSPVFLIGTVIYLVLLVNMIWIRKTWMIDEVSNRVMMTRPLSFLYFLVISYEFFYQETAQKVREVLRVSRRGWIWDKVNGVLFFCVPAAALSLVYLGIMTWTACGVMGAFVESWFVMMGKVCLIYHFLLYFLAILLGLLISGISSRLKGFTVLIFVYSLFSKVLLPVIMRCAAGSDSLTHRFDIFGIMNRSYSVACDLFYNYSTEPVNVQRMLFWIFLIGGLLLCTVCRGKKIVLPGAFFCASVLCLVLFIQPSGERYVRGDWGAYMAEQTYYNLLFSEGAELGYSDASLYSGIGRKYSEADFQVLSYQGKLTVKRQLEASVDFKLQVEAGQKVYSNLAEETDSCFTGTSEGATFVASPFMAKMELEHASVYYPVLSAEYWKQNIQTTKKEYEKQLEPFLQLLGTDHLVVFDVSSMGNAVCMWYVTDDHIIASASQLEYLYPKYKKTGITPNWS